MHDEIRNVTAQCDICSRYKNAPLQTVVGFPLATQFNETDLQSRCSEEDDDSYETADEQSDFNTSSRILEDEFDHTAPGLSTSCENRNSENDPSGWTHVCTRVLLLPIKFLYFKIELCKIFFPRQIYIRPHISNFMKILQV